MKPIEKIELAELVQEANDSLLEEKRSGLLSLIKSNLNELNQVTAKIAQTRTDLSKLEEKQSKLAKWISEVQKGNWEVLNLAEKKEKKEDN